MTVTVLLILAIAIVLLPLIQRDLRAAHERVGRRRLSARQEAQLVRLATELADRAGWSFSDAVRALQAAMAEPVEPLQRRWPR